MMLLSMAITANAAKDRIYIESIKIDSSSTLQIGGEINLILSSRTHSDTIENVNTLNNFCIEVDSFTSFLFVIDSIAIHFSSASLFLISDSDIYNITLELFNNKPCTGLTVFAESYIPSCEMENDDDLLNMITCDYSYRPNLNIQDFKCINRNQ